MPCRYKGITKGIPRVVTKFLNEKVFLVREMLPSGKLNLINQCFPTKSPPATEQPLESNVAITQAMTDENTDEQHI